MPARIRKPGLVDTLVAAAEGISHIEQLDPLLQAVLTDARKLARAEAAAVWLLTPEHRLCCRAQQLLPVGPRAWAGRDGQVIELSAASPAGLAAARGQDLWIDRDHLPGEATFASPIGHDLVTGYSTSNMLVLPLFDESAGLLGILEMLNTRLHPSAASGGSGGTLGDQQASLGRICAVGLRNALLRDQLRQMQQETVHRLSHAVEFCDEHMHNHIRRMSRTAGILARAMELPDDLAAKIEYAAPMHDIGKLAVPEAILRAPRRLRPAQRKLLEAHAHLGAELLDCSSNEILILARQMALTHHERWDGAGYPKRLCGDQIPLAGRICALADVFDALVSRRSYKQAYPIGAAVGMVQAERGGHFDPGVVDAFTRALRTILDLYEYPVVRPAAA